MVVSEGSPRLGKGTEYSTFVADSCGDLRTTNHEPQKEPEIFSPPKLPGRTRGGRRSECRLQSARDDRIQYGSIVYHKNKEKQERSEV